jgi:hypothetical protein
MFKTIFKQKDDNKTRIAGCTKNTMAGNVLWEKTHKSSVVPI